MKQILMILGTRPEAIKMAPLYWALKETEGLSVRLCHTGQHETMTDSALSAFGITPELRLSLPEERDSLWELTARLLCAVSELLLRERPDLALIHGDTASTFAASLACFYCGIPTAHVEAGLRSGSLTSPFPEEWNRRAVALTAALHFAPTERAKNALLAEGISAERIFTVGNTAMDALRYTVRRDFAHPLWEACRERRLLFFTAHRRESWGEPLAGMLRGLKTVLRGHPDTVAILPMHPNPSVRTQVRESLEGERQALLTEPLPTEVCHNLLSRATLVLTDSGGIQEEAGALGIPTLVMRQHTERQEGLSEAGGPLFLVGQEETAIVSAAHRLLSDPEAYARAAVKTDAFGDGFASTRIAAVLQAYLAS